jgi:hypothetical protein
VFAGLSLTVKGSAACFQRVACAAFAGIRFKGVRLRARSGAAARPTTKGDTVPTVIAHHDVKDKDHWLASPKREEVFGPLGVTNIRTFVDPQNPTRVAVLMDVADMDVVMGAMQTEAMAEAMAYDGVLPETVVILVEA